ncbi:MAG: hypothetical protein CME65_05930 [Halobacteriovoraceae bacterium]|nr:hypothetical protein [Halobacteriovoraceae bacterium]|tara:strand:- start:808 stop:2106 length:1299 start_codon:yes stop_codon:yes gene_type:complete
MTESNNQSDTNEYDSEHTRKGKFSPKEEITSENCKFTEGEVLRFVKVRFPGHARSYSFLVGDRTIMYGQKVIAMSDRGMAVGYINSFVYNLPFKQELLPLRSIKKIATEEDIADEKENYKKQKETETICQKLIEKHNLDMNLTHVEFTQFGKKVVFYFVAPSRVDFRGLVKDLVGELRLRIELRQISVRDRAASQGAVGPCGRELCCSSFLGKYGNVSIKMAKNQNLTLNYSKLNGVCGQLKCCLKYEDDVYSFKRKNLPREGSYIKTKNGDSGQVKKLNILSEQFDMLTDKGVIKSYVADEFEYEYEEGTYKFPRKFDNISHQTSEVIGIENYESQLKERRRAEFERLDQMAHNFAIDKISEVSDYLPERERSDMTKVEVAPEQVFEKRIINKSAPQDSSHNRSDNRGRNRRDDKHKPRRRNNRHHKKGQS